MCGGSCVWRYQGDSYLVVPQLLPADIDSFEFLVVTAIQGEQLRGGDEKGLHAVVASD